jgi:signal peptidase I
VSDPWDADESWTPGRRDASAPDASLRRHSQPRHAPSASRLPTGVETGPDGVPLDGMPFDGARYDRPPFDRPPFDRPPFDGAPFDQAPFDQAPFDDGPDANWLVPSGRRPDPSSLDPGLTAMRGPLDGVPDAPDVPDFGGGSGRDAPPDLFPGARAPVAETDLQPGSRLRVGPRHGAGGKREERAPKTPLRAALGAGSEVLVVLGMALLLSLLIKTFLVQAFFIPSSSMENTLLIGDRVLVSKLTPGVFDLHRGDVVVFKDPGGWLTAEGGQPPPQDGGVGSTVRNALSFVGLLPQDSGEHLIKRVVGVGGDHVVCCDANNRVTVNGAPIDETAYLVPGARPSDKPFDVTVPYGYLWVMGDNRPVSADSRLHRQLNNGMVPVHDVVGKAFVVVWPFDRAGGLGVPAGVFARVPAPAAR